MHVLFLSDNFPPEVNAPASRTHEHCRAWVASGARVTVITCAPNFPTGRVYPGYRNWLWSHSVVDGIRVVRVWTYMAPNEGFFRRIVDHLSYMVMASCAALFVRRVDVVVGTSPQFFTACAAWVVGVLKWCPWVFEVRDIWPESIKAVGMMGDSRALRLLERLELFLYRRADRVVVVTRSFKERLVARGVNSSKIEVVTNGVDLQNFSPRARDAGLAASLGLDGCFVAGYIGTHGLAHGLETLLQAAQILQDDPGASDVRILFLGDGARKDELVRSASDAGLRNVLFLPSVPKERVADYWSLLDVSIIHLRRSELFGTVIPSKLFECMGMGIPVLHGVPGESADIVRREAVGEPFESEDAQGLATALLALRNDPRRMAELRANAAAAASRYDRRNLAAGFLDLLERLHRR